MANLQRFVGILESIFEGFFFQRQSSRISSVALANIYIQILINLDLQKVKMENFIWSIFVDFPDRTTSSVYIPPFW